MWRTAKETSEVLALNTQNTKNTKFQHHDTDEYLHVCMQI